MAIDSLNYGDFKQIYLEKIKAKAEESFIDAKYGAEQARLYGNKNGDPSNPLPVCGEESPATTATYKFDKGREWDVRTSTPNITAEQVYSAIKKSHPNALLDKETVVATFKFAISQNINPVFIFGVSANETGWWSSRAWREQWNPGGVKGSGPYKSFKSQIDGYEHMISNMTGGEPMKGRYYYKAGKYTIGAIGAVWAEDKNWPNLAINIMKQHFGLDVNAGTNGTAISNSTAVASVSDTCTPSPASDGTPGKVLSGNGTWTLKYGGTNGWAPTLSGAAASHKLAKTVQAKYNNSRQNLLDIVIDPGTITKNGKVAPRSGTRSQYSATFQKAIQDSGGISKCPWAMNVTGHPNIEPVAPRDYNKESPWLAKHFVAALEVLHAKCQSFKPGKFKQNSTYRNHVHNMSAYSNNPSGYTAWSQHISGTACDLMVSGHDTREKLSKLALDIGFGSTGIDHKVGYVHLDIGPYTGKYYY